MLGADAVAATNGPFVGVADGIYNTADTRWRKADIKASAYSLFSALNATNATNAAIEMPRLASSAYEIRSCASAWNCRREPVLLTGSDATRHHLSAALERRPAVIHIAAHVVYHQDHPDDALIHLGLSAGGAEVLTTKDIANLRADGALVVLSACSSAAGNSVRGAGVLGLTRAWLLAGARAVVGSRWPVPDDTGELFRSFYAHLATASNARQDFSSALQHAQLQMLQSRTWRSDPKYWGAFYLLAKE
jgi:CHAT domain-containing protein